MSRTSVPVSATAPVFAALGSTVRLELLSRLSDGNNYSITELSDGLALTRQAVTKHLTVLEQAGIVDTQRVGRERQFRIQPGPVSHACDYLARISAQWDDAIDRLRAVVEDP